MIWIRRVGVAAAAMMLVWAVPHPARGAGFQETTQSAVATGMANSGVANPEEPNSSFFNPAAMPYGDGFDAYVGATLIYPTFNYQPFGAADDNGQVDAEDNVFPLPNIHVGYALTDDLSAGIGVTAPFGLAVEWPENWVGRDVNEFVQLATFNLNPNLAYRIADTGLSVAAGAQIVYSYVELHRDVPLGGDRFVQAELGGDGWGFGGVAAAMYRPTDKLSFGAQYRSRVKVDYDGSNIHFSGEESTPFYRTFRDNPATTDITMPDVISAGASYRWSQLLVQLQIDYTLWNSFNSIDVDIDTGQDDQAIDSLVIEEHWDNALSFRVGAQYDIFGIIPVRAGLAYEMTPVPDATASATLPDNDRIAASVGLGYQWARNWRFDLAYEYVGIMQRDIRNDIGPVGDYNGTGHVLSFDVGYAIR